MKKIYELIGLIGGVSFDGEINQKEIDRLHTWVDQNRNLAYEAREIELINIVDTILEDRIITDNEKELLLEYCYKFNEETIGYSEIYRLQSILEGIISDGIINDLEVKRLQDWMKIYTDVLNKNPKCQTIVKMINEIIEDGVVADEEKHKLLDIIENQMEDVRFEAKLAFLIDQVKKQKNIGMDLIDLIGDDKSIAKIHNLAMKELRRGLKSHFGFTTCNKELIFVSLTIIAMLHYEEGRFYESACNTYNNLYYSEQKKEGHIRSILAKFRANPKERQVNVVLRNTIVPSYYLASFFDFIYDIYKINFQFQLPDDIYEEFKFVYDGFRQMKHLEDDSVKINVSKKTYKLINTTRQLILDEKSVDSIIKLSIIIVRLIDKKIWNKKIKVYNPYLKQGFDKWAKKLNISSHDLKKHKKASKFRSSWKPKYILFDNNVYIVPPVHKIESAYDYRTIRIEIENQGEVLYSNSRPYIREIVGGYEVSLDKIKISKPLGEVVYRIYAGDVVKYDSKNKMHRNIIAFSYKNNLEIKNNSDFSGNVIFCYQGKSNRLQPYYQTSNYCLAQYGAYHGDSVFIGNEIFNFSSLIRPGLFGEERGNHHLYDSGKKQKYKVFKEAKYIVFETINYDAEIEVNIDEKPFKLNDFEYEEHKREGVVKYIIYIPVLNSGFHVITIYELMLEKRTKSFSVKFVIDTDLQIETRENSDNAHIVTVKSFLLNDVVTKIISADSFSPKWLSFQMYGREFSYLLPLPFTYYSLDGEVWKTEADYLWIGDVSLGTSIKVNNNNITELQVFAPNGNILEDPINFSDKILYKEAKIGFLKSYAENNDYFRLVMMGNTAREAMFICYNKCMISDKTKIEYNVKEKCLEIEILFFGKGRIYFTLTDSFGEQLFKSDLVKNGEVVKIKNLESFTFYHVNFFEKKCGLSLKGDRKLETKQKVIYDWSDLPDKTFKITDVLYDQFEKGKFIRKRQYFKKTFLSIKKQLHEGLYEGEIFSKTRKGRFYLFNINPVEVEICGEAVDGTVELSITKNGDGLLLDFNYHNIMNTLNDQKAVDIFSYIIDLNGFERN